MLSILHLLCLTVVHPLLRCPGRCLSLPSWPLFSLALVCLISVLSRCEPSLLCISHHLSSNSCLQLVCSAETRKRHKAERDKTAADAQLDAISVRVGELKTDDAKAAEKPCATRGRYKRGDLTADCKVRMCYDDHELLSGQVQSCARKYKCSPQACGRARDQLSESVLSQRDDATYSLLEGGADLFASCLASLEGSYLSAFHIYIYI